jgi:peptide methionine sulfoxide reductase MsrB
MLNKFFTTLLTKKHAGWPRCRLVGSSLFSSRASISRQYWRSYTEVVDTMAVRKHAVPSAHGANQKWPDNTPAFRSRS